MSSFYFRDIHKNTQIIFFLVLINDDMHVLIDVLRDRLRVRDSRSQMKIFVFV